MILLTRLADTNASIVSWIGIHLAMMAPAVLNLLPAFPSRDTQENILPA